jgi:hypothetical protein
MAPGLIRRRAPFLHPTMAGARRQLAPSTTPSLLHEVGKVARSAGWGVESGGSLDKVLGDGRANRPGVLVRATPHPASGHLPQQKLGKGRVHGRPDRLVSLGRPPCRANSAFTLPREKGCALEAALLKGAFTTMRAIR